MQNRSLNTGYQRKHTASQMLARSLLSRNRCKFTGFPQATLPFQMTSVQGHTWINILTNVSGGEV